MLLIKNVINKTNNIIDKTIDIIDIKRHGINKIKQGMLSRK